MFQMAFLLLLLNFILCASVVKAEWPDPISNEVIPYETTGITHGPLLGAVTSTSVRLWIRTETETPFTIRYGTALPLNEKSSQVAGQTNAAQDFTGTIELANLQPATTYFYAVVINEMVVDLRVDLHDDWPHFRTLPDSSTTVDPLHNPQGKFNISFGIGHCASQAPVESGGQYTSPPVYDTMLKKHREEMQFALVNGDVIYEAERDGTREGVRKNYRLYFQRGRSFSRLFRNTPALFTFDDHDVGWDLHGAGQVGLQRDGPHLIRDLGLTAYEEYLSWANYPGSQRGRILLGTGRVTAGSDLLVDQQADFSQLDPKTVSTIHLGAYTRKAENNKRDNSLPRVKNAGVYGLTEIVGPHQLRITPPVKADAELTYSIGTHHYYDWQIGNAHFFALDTRGERSLRNSKDRSDPSLFILGKAQQKWLMEGIKQSNAEFIFLISPDPWMIYHTAAHVNDDPEAVKDDKGDGFPSFLHERNVLLDFLDHIQKPVLIFTGDVHASASVKITDNVWEMMCGPLGSTGHPLATLGNPTTGGLWDSYDREVMIRWVSPFPNNVHYSRIRNTFYGIVQVNNVLKTTGPSGEKPQFVAYESPTVTVRWHDGYTGRLVYAETISTTEARSSTD